MALRGGGGAGEGIDGTGEGQKWSGMPRRAYHTAFIGWSLSCLSPGCVRVAAMRGRPMYVERAPLPPVDGGLPQDVRAALPRSASVLLRVHGVCSKVHRLSGSAAEVVPPCAGPTWPHYLPVLSSLASVGYGGYTHTSGVSGSRCWSLG